jgi:hypothetical protein
MSRYDSIVSAEAWEGLVRDYRTLCDEGDDDNDFAVAELLREAIQRVEG